MSACHRAVPGDLCVILCEGGLGLVSGVRQSQTRGWHTRQPDTWPYAWHRTPGARPPPDTGWPGQTSAFNQITGQRFCITSISCSFYPWNWETVRKSRGNQASNPYQTVKQGVFSRPSLSSQHLLIIVFKASHKKQIAARSRDLPIWG